LTFDSKAPKPIDHIIVLMKENRSFGHLFGPNFGTAGDNKPAPNLDDKGNAVMPFHLETTCVDHDPPHQWAAMHLEAHDGLLDGFVHNGSKPPTTDGHYVMGYYTRDDLPFYNWFATTFARNDRHFASARSGTFPNRNFLLLGAADGIHSTDDGPANPNTPSIFDALDKAKIAWGTYSDGDWLDHTLGWEKGHAGTYSFADFLTALDAGTLPQVAFVDSLSDIEDEHPTANVQQGENWTRFVYEHAIASPLWPKLALIWTYDEGGGFYDPIAPPNHACLADSSPKNADFFELGTRVPLVVASPYARPGFVSGVVQDHTAITRFIEWTFDLPALTARDANANAMLELFDFASSPSFLAPSAAPEAGVHGCEKTLQFAASKASFRPNEPLVFQIKDSEPHTPGDYVAIYPRGRFGPTPPNANALAYLFIGGKKTPTMAPRETVLLLDAKAIEHATWPLPKGRYVAYYLRDHTFKVLRETEFSIEE
jgi:phospholipase C